LGFRLKSQLLALCLSLMLVTLGALSYFHLTISSQDSLIRSDLVGRKTAQQAMQQVLLFVNSSENRQDLMRCLAQPNSRNLVESLRRTPDLIEFSIFSVDGTQLLGSGSPPDSLQVQQATYWVQQHQESYYEIWGDQGGRSEPLIEVPPFYGGRVVHHSYHPLFDPEGKLMGLTHLAVQLPRAPMRINLIVTGYFTVATIFLISSMLAIYLWAEFALNRPLRGLTNSLQELRSLDPTGNRPDNLPQPNELSEAARALNHVTLDLVKYQRELQQKTEHLEKLNEELEQKVAEKTLQIREFFSLITHDLRVPLAAVSGYADLFSDPRSGSLTDKQQRYLQHITVANRDAQELVRNLLEAMKYEFGQPALEPEEFNLRELVAEIQGQLAVVGKPIELVADPGQNWLVWGDRTRLGRVFSNLLSNALAHAGEVRVELTAEARQVRVSVSDRGPGIKPEELPGLFEKFKGSRSGLGLGLYIVHRILQDHRQEILVDSKLGEGTTFGFAIARNGPNS